jgi:hypothetical protein
MYPEVHNLASATLCWSDVEAKALQTPQMHHRIFSSLPTKREVLDPLRTLEGDHKPLQAWGNIWNLIGCSQEITMKASHLRNLHYLIEGPKKTIKITKPSRV